MYRLAVELIEKRYPEGWGGAGVVHTSAGHYYTSVSIDTANAVYSSVDNIRSVPYNKTRVAKRLF